MKQNRIGTLLLNGEGPNPVYSVATGVANKAPGLVYYIVCGCPQSVAR